MAEEPGTPLLSARLAWFGAAGAVLLGLLARWRGLLPGDVWLSAFLQSLRGAPLRTQELLGYAAGLILLAVLLAPALRARLRLLPLAVVMVLVPMIEWTLKTLVGRERPTGVGLGFPSGHAIGSLALALLVAGALWPWFSSKERAGFTVLASIFVLGVGISRVGLGMHWPSDILGGWLVGLAYAIWTLPLVRRERSQTHVP